MSKKFLVRYSIVLWLIAILIDAVNNLFPSNISQVAMIVVPFLGTFAMISIYLFQRKQVGLFGVIALTVDMIGSGLLPIAHMANAFVYPHVPEDVAMSLLTGALNSAIMVGLYIFILGVVLESIAVLIAKVFSPIPAVLLILAYLPYLFLSVVPSWVIMVGTILGQVAVIWLSVQLWQKSGEEEFAT